ncbi:SIMPL domain-containing protein [Methanococcoides methylutens]|uniref:SIMPL domain-containing protein n=1 Tax=Methanococcoides methylutens TaxID=2226 RepID=UPI004043F34D
MQEPSNNKLYYVLLALSIAVVLLAAVIYAGPFISSDQSTESTIFITGDAQTNIAPDTASLSIGVVVQSPTAKEASDENAVLMNAVIKELKDFGLQDNEIKTSYVSVYPVYSYDGEPTIEAYSASNNVQITTKSLDKVGEIIDRSTAAGANQIGGVSFTVSDEKRKELRDELVTAAVDDASSKADQLADSLGVKIVGVRSSSINDGQISPIYYEVPAMAEEAIARTPIEPGENTVSLSVQVTYIVK